jgi:hypothetical protein
LITPQLMGLAVVRIEPEQRTFFDFLEAYLRYRPVSTTAWRWSVKAGAFFPPVSLENTELGWTSPWTLTPSAINTWVGEELRTIGTEGMLEWRSEARTLAFMASIYGWNDPAGVLVADRGWALHDRVTGLIDRPREPDAIAYALHVPTPLYTYEVLEIDNRPGWRRCLLGRDRSRQAQSHLLQQRGQSGGRPQANRLAHRLLECRGEYPDRQCHASGAGFDGRNADRAEQVLLQRHAF